jgi:hypothetical protein
VNDSAEMLRDVSGAGGGDIVDAFAEQLTLLVPDHAAELVRDSFESSFETQNDPKLVVRSTRRSRRNDVFQPSSSRDGHYFNG